MMTPLVSWLLVLPVVAGCAVAGWLLLTLVDDMLEEWRGR